MPGLSSIRVLLADDEPMVCSALGLLLDQEPGITLAGAAAEHRCVWQSIDALQPNVLLLDWELPGGASVPFLHRLRDAMPDMRIIVLSSRPEVQPLALVAGADAFVSKGDPPDRLLAAIHALFPDGPPA